MVSVVEFPTTLSTWERGCCRGGGKSVAKGWKAKSVSDSRRGNGFAAEFFFSKRDFSYLSPGHPSREIRPNSRSFEKLTLGINMCVVFFAYKPEVISSILQVFLPIGVYEK